MNLSPEQIVSKMMQKDTFSQWLGINIEKIDLGHVRISMQVNDKMVNGFGIAHGGISFSLADSAFAFASNSRGDHCVSIETSINHFKPVFAGDTLVANSNEINIGRNLRFYEVTVQNQKKDIVAFFKGTVFNTGKKWE